MYSTYGSYNWKAKYAFNLVIGINNIITWSNFLRIKWINLKLTLFSLGKLPTASCGQRN